VFERGLKDLVVRERVLLQKLRLNMVDEGGRHKLLSDKVRREGVVTQFKC